MNKDKCRCGHSKKKHHNWGCSVFMCRCIRFVTAPYGETETNKKMKGGKKECQKKLQ